ncbi:MAG TPA: HAMP domain-containing histidine kinase [Deltaproteobacteria bacterium]|nr:HAMP domain-containing histidine kinase [Deltaproteobacteria bacterium]
MKNPRRWPTVVIFIAVQAAWLAIVIMWVVWYIRYRHISIAPIGAWDIVIIVEVSVLLLLILIGIYALFILYQKQLTLMRSQMHIISSITHAFKTPLATMQLYLETIEKRELPEETKNQLLHGMLEENQRLKNLVNNFLESARISYNRRPYIFSTIMISDLLDTFISDYENLLRGVRVCKNIQDDGPVRVDKDAFSIVLSNLMENAIHYSTDTPKIDIKTWTDRRWVYIEFSDFGIGIPRDKYRDIFKRFQRLPDAITLWGSGTGMGLYVVKAIIKAHGGTIKVSGGNIGSGTTFLIRLPVARS